MQPEKSRGLTQVSLAQRDDLLKLLVASVPGFVIETWLAHVQSALHPPNKNFFVVNFENLDFSITNLMAFNYQLNQPMRESILPAL